MATLVLSAAGAALGGAMGGSMAGLTTLALGKAIGATVGNVLDQKLLGAGSEPVETGRVERFRVMGSSEGSPLPRVFGRTRVAGQVIWSSRFLETVNSSEMGGKGGGATVRDFSYSISLAIALCEGEVLRIGRIWADGQSVDQATLGFRLHRGDEAQIPDPLIAAIEGNANAPAYRGTAYVVFENLDLTPYGNRIPQFNFEVFRRAKPASASVPPHPADRIRGVALVPGTGEYALETEPVYLTRGKGDTIALNIHNDRGLPNLQASIEQLEAEMPQAKAVSLVVTWFGDDLRCGRCSLRPMVEQTVEDPAGFEWKVSGLSREQALEVGRIDGRPAFGGTPSDHSVLQAIRYLRGRGFKLMFYPFILMNVFGSNGRLDPWTLAEHQPQVPWRGRITLDAAPGVAGSADKTPAAADEVTGFFGTAAAGQFGADGDLPTFSGPDEWSYRRFILHYAHLCAQAGGVDAFCVGSEMRGLTQIRDGVESYPAVRELSRLTADVRGVVGAETKLGYAADWSEYSGHRPGDGSNDVIFNLDPLWAHPDTNFVGIDNYMPISDWRDEAGHTDAAAGSIYDLGYLGANVGGGEGFDWYYADDAARDAQARSAIRDTAHGEDWVFRYKDLSGWWSNPHVNRIGGVRGEVPTAWVPQSKPIWFTELGCPCVDKGTNQPNVFHDPKSSESFFPYFSEGLPDEFIQIRYLQAVLQHWTEPKNNPVSALFGRPMVDLDHAFVWAWDTRPWPDFPGRLETWTDGTNHAHGHWLNGRTSLEPLAEVVADICERSGLTAFDVSGVYGAVTGYAIDAIQSARQALQPLMLAYAIDSTVQDGIVAFAGRGQGQAAAIDIERLVCLHDTPVVMKTVSSASDTPGRLVLTYIQGSADYAAGAVEAVVSDAAQANTTTMSVPIVLGQGAAQDICEKWVNQGRVAQESLSLTLPLSRLALVAGDSLTVNATSGDAAYAIHTYRIDRVEEFGFRTVTALQMSSSLYRRVAHPSGFARVAARPASVPPHLEMFELPLLRGDEAPHAPYVAATQRPWTGPVTVYASDTDYGYRWNLDLRRPATMGETLEALPRAGAGQWMNTTLDLRIGSGALQSRTRSEVLNGANLAALGDPTGDLEVFQFEAAELVAPGLYRLRGLLRGQAGTDAILPEAWPAGTDFVLLDAAITQLDVSPVVRGREVHLRAGPSNRPYTDGTYQHLSALVRGIGYRPYRPVHLVVETIAIGQGRIRWTRRTRVDGDDWQDIDVPLGEEREIYLVRLIASDGRVLEETCSTPAFNFSYETTAGLPLLIEVAQVSSRFGPGPFARTTFHG